MTEERKFAVQIFYTDGRTITAGPMTKDHAEKHLETVVTYPTVHGAILVEIEEDEDHHKER